MGRSGGKVRYSTTSERNWETQREGFTKEKEKKREREVSWIAHSLVGNVIPES